MANRSLRCVSLPRPAVKSRLISGFVRGPVVAMSPLPRDHGEAPGERQLPYNTFVPIMMVGTILVGEYLSPCSSRCSSGGCCWQ